MSQIGINLYWWSHVILFPFFLWQQQQQQKQRKPIRLWNTTSFIYIFTTKTISKSYKPFDYLICSSIFFYSSFICWDTEEKKKFFFSCILIKISSVNNYTHLHEYQRNIHLHFFRDNQRESRKANAIFILNCW